MGPGLFVLDQLQQHTDDPSELLMMWRVCVSATRTQLILKYNIITEKWECINCNLSDVAFRAECVSEVHYHLCTALCPLWISHMIFGFCLVCLGSHSSVIFHSLPHFLIRLLCFNTDVVFTTLHLFHSFCIPSVSFALLPGYNPTDLYPSSVTLNFRF